MLFKTIAFALLATAVCTALMLGLQRRRDQRLAVLRTNTTEISLSLDEMKKRLDRLAVKLGRPDYSGTKTKSQVRIERTDLRRYRK